MSTTTQSPSVSNRRRNLTIAGVIGLTAVILATSWYALPYVAVALVVVLGFKFVVDRLTAYDDDAEIEVKNNVALGVQRGALYLALFLGMGGAALTPRHGYWNGVLTFAIDAVVVTVALIVFSYLIDWVVLRKVSNQSAIASGNLSVGIVEAGSYLGLGAILCGSFSGEGGGVLSGLQFSALGSLSLIGWYLLYERIARHNIRECILQDNRASAVEAGGFLAAAGIVLAFSISGPFEGWVSDMILYGEALVGHVLVLALVMWVLDVVMLRQTDLTTKDHHGKVATSLVLSGITVGTALLIGLTA